MVRLGIKQVRYTYEYKYYCHISQVRGRCWECTKLPTIGSLTTLCWLTNKYEGAQQSQAEAF